jgi:hypothetical protein
MECTPYQWIATIESCPYCAKEDFPDKTSNISMKSAIGEAIKSAKRHKKYCDGVDKPGLFSVKVNIKWKNMYVFKSTWEEHKIYV